MALVTEKPAAAFDLDQIGQGCLLWGRHRTWKEGKAGIVTSATEGRLTVQYCPGIGNVTNHFVIPVSEAADGQWEIRWSADLAKIQEHGVAEDTDGPEMGRQETEGVEDDDTGRTDL